MHGKKFSIKVVFNNIKYIIKKASIITASLIGILQIIGFLCEFNEVFPNDLSFIKRLIISAISVAVIWSIIFIIFCFVVNVTNRIKVINAKNGHSVYVEYGDLFIQENNSRIVVVTANRCFDTIVDNDLISETTVHGKAINYICKDGYTEKMLNEALQKDLNDIRKIMPEKVLSASEKRKGNLKRYPAGTIAEYNKGDGDKTTYFFVGMSAFNYHLHPETTDLEYAMVIQSLVEYCRQRSQRMPIYMPIIGAHGRNAQKTERELLEYMINVLRFNKHMIDTDIHIVVYHGNRDEVPIHGLQFNHK